MKKNGRPRTIAAKNGNTAKPRGKPWQKGQSGNPKGRPRTGESWGELIKHIGEMTPKAASDYCKAIAGKLASIGDGITLKEAVVLRVYTSLMFEPQPGLFNAFMERTEGKVKDQVELSGDTSAPFKVVVEYVNDWRGAQASILSVEDDQHQSAPDLPSDDDWDKA